MAFVGTGECSSYPKNKLIFWNDYSQEPCAEIEFVDEVISCRLGKNLIAIVLKNRINIHNFKDLSLFDQFNTYTNIQGICAMADK